MNHLHRQISAKPNSPQCSTSGVLTLTGLCHPTQSNGDKTESSKAMHQIAHVNTCSLGPAHGKVIIPSPSPTAAQQDGISSVAHFACSCIIAILSVYESDRWSTQVTHLRTWLLSNLGEKADKDEEVNMGSFIHQVTIKCLYPVILMRGNKVGSMNSG
jgi:hypothetical protein